MIIVHVLSGQLSIVHVLTVQVFIVHVLTVQVPITHVLTAQVFIVHVMATSINRACADRTQRPAVHSCMAVLSVNSPTTAKHPRNVAAP